MTSPTLYKGVLALGDGNGKVTFAIKLEFTKTDNVIVGISS
jgi:hypothetical protein